jgi:hypothetical protein
MTSLLVFLINKLNFTKENTNDMAAKSKIARKILHYQKYLGLALIALGIPTIIIDKAPGADLPLLIGLFTLLVATEKNEDERSAQIKVSSLYIAFIVAYAAKLLTSNLYDHELIPFELTSINHFLILTLALANAIFYGRLHIFKQ